ncbi:MAG: 3-dehydroquinate synthase [Georgenia sp.]
MVTDSSGLRAVLVGPPGAGKTTVGRLIAAALGVEFLDTDEEVERVAGMSIAELFVAEGEAAFRALEHETVLRVLAEHDGVVALGGGAVMHPGTRAALVGHPVVFLDVDVAQAVARVGRSRTRPLLAGDPGTRFTALMAERRAVYESVATVHHATTHRRPRRVAADILRELARRGEAAVDAVAVHEGDQHDGDGGDTGGHAVEERRVAGRTTAGDRVDGHATAGDRPDGQEAADGAQPTRIEVAGAAPYDVVIGRGLTAEIDALVGSVASRVLVVHPPTLAETAEALRAALGRGDRTVLRHEVPDAEQAKTIDVVAAAWDLLGAERFGREDVVVALGGGATTDVAGFIAASWLRGVRLVNLPTTLLAMVDAAVGGKTGINTAAGKNLVGAFYPPAGVICDLAVLRTLPGADLRAGLAEVVKCGFIADPKILRLVEADGGAGALDPRSAVLRELVERAVAVKARVVGEDLRETGPREILNYGHTFAHAIERTEDYRWRHGDAVAVGMVFAAELAHAAGILDADVVRHHREILTMLGLPVSYRGGRWDALIDAMASDKKVRGDALRFVVLEDVGRTTVLRAPAPEHLHQAYDRVRS